MKKIILTILLSLNISCMNLDFFLSPLYKLSEEKREAKIESLYNSLSEKYYILLEDEIKEKDRLELEERFQKLSDEIEKVKNNTVSMKYLDFMSDKHREFLNKYSREVNLKLQYLKDLK